LGFSADVWGRVGRLVDAIVDHPFNHSLIDATLDPEVFAFYLIQDARYLAGFARALAAASVAAPDAEAAAFWAGSAHQAIVVEAELHAGYLGTRDVATVATSPSALAYASWLQATALSGPYQVLVAALLPCFWIYEHVGRVTLAGTAGRPEHPYRRWIDTYGGEDFAASVGRARRLVDAAADGADEASRAAMAAAFVRATEYEWMFWDSAWHREGWPTARWLN